MRFPFTIRPRPIAGATPRETRVFHWSLLAQALGFGAGFVGVVAHAPLVAVVAGAVWAVAWLTLGAVLLRIVGRQHRANLAELEAARAALEAHHAARRAALHLWRANALSLPTPDDEGTVEHGRSN